MAHFDSPRIASGVVPIVENRRMIDNVEDREITNMIEYIAAQRRRVMGAALAAGSLAFALLLVVAGENDVAMFVMAGTGAALGAVQASFGGWRAHTLGKLPADERVDFNECVDANLTAGLGSFVVVAIGGGVLLAMLTRGPAPAVLGILAALGLTFARYSLPDLPRTK